MKKSHSAPSFPVVLFVLVVGATALIGPVAHTRASAPAKTGAATPGSQLVFERNDGQHPVDVRFVARGAGFTLAMRERTVAMKLATEKGAAQLAMTFEGARTGSGPRAERPAAARVNYFVGRDPQAWHTDVPTFERVRYPRLYDGIDIVFYGTGRRLEYDLVVAPGARPGAARVRFDGARSMRVAEDGSLVLTSANGDVRYSRPNAYQLENGVRHAVDAAYRIDGDAVTFEAGAYDRSRELVIDPVLVFSTYLGSTGTDYVGSVAVDAAGATYATGTTTSTEFPISPNAPRKNMQVSEAYVTKFDRNGVIQYSTFFGASSSDGGTAIAVDAAGAAYVLGFSESRDLPVTAGAFQTKYGGGDSDVFVMKLSAAGNKIVYATYLGGSGDEPFLAARGGIAVDPTGVATIVSSTNSGDFPTTSGALQRTHPAAVEIAFAARLNATGTALVFSTLLTGTTQQDARGVALDAQGRAIVVGRIDGDMTTTKTVGPVAFRDGYALKLNETGSALVFSTRFGGSDEDAASAVTYDPNRDVAFVTGATASSDFPATGIQSFKGVADAFLVTIGADGSQSFYNALVGGSKSDQGFGIGSSGDTITLFGSTTSPDFPTVNPMQPMRGFSDVFMTRLRGSANILFSTTIGGSDIEDLDSGVIDGAGLATIGGQTFSNDFPVKFPASGAHATGDPADGFVARVAMVPRGTPGPHDVVVHVADVATLHGDWEKLADPSAAGGSLLHNPDRGRAKVSTPLAAPSDYFEFTVHGLSGGPYRLWMRGKADADSYTNDSVWVQFERAQNAGADADNEHDIFRIGTTEAMAVVVEDCNHCNVHGWGWQDGGYGQKVLGPWLYFNTDAPTTIRVQRREDGISIDQIVIAKYDVGEGPYGEAAPGYQKDDDTILPPQDPFSGPDVVIYPASDGASPHGSWAVTADASAADGNKLRNLDAGAAKLTTPLAQPTSYFDVTFNARAGAAYRLWIRGRADADFYGNDSAYVQFSGSVDDNGAPVWRIGTTSATTYVLEDCNGCGVQGWGWNDNAYGAGALGRLVHFAADGPQTIRVQTREDGLSIDQIVLSPERYLNTAPGATRNDTTVVQR